MRLDEVLSCIPVCPRQNCGYRILCHRPIARSREEFSKVPHEIAVVLPERWLCLPYYIHNDGILECEQRSIPASTVEKWLTGGLFGALAQLEENDFACLSVDVHYPDSRQVMVLYNYYHFAGTLAILVAGYRGPVGVLRTGLVTDEAQKAVRFLKSWRRRFGREVPQDASFSQSNAATLPYRRFQSL